MLLYEVYIMLYMYLSLYISSGDLPHCTTQKDAKTVVHENTDSHVARCLYTNTHFPRVKKGTTYVRGLPMCETQCPVTTCTYCSYGLHDSW